MNFANIDALLARVDDVFMEMEMSIGIPNYTGAKESVKLIVADAYLRGKGKPELS